MRILIFFQYACVPGDPIREVVDRISQAISSSSDFK